jgi:DNA-directed RNA polymerase specialized sigma24 family protein
MRSTQPPRQERPHDEARWNRANEQLPVAQRRLTTMRDIAGLGADGVYDGLPGGNHRVLLHRVRSHLRAALKVRLDG